MSDTDTHHSHDVVIPVVEDGESDDEGNTIENRDDDVDMYELEEPEDMLNDEHVLTTWRHPESSEDMNSPRISLPIQEHMPEGSPTMPTSPLVVTDQPVMPTGVMMVPLSDRMLNATAATNQFTVDAPMTQAGQKRRVWGLQSILVVCTCGQTVSENEIEEDENIIKCKCAGCETGWVSESS